MMSRKLSVIRKELLSTESIWALPELIFTFASFFVRSNMGVILERIANDKRCNTHSQLLGSRVEKNGWFDIYCPVNSICFDEGVLWSAMVITNYISVQSW